MPQLIFSPNFPAFPAYLISPRSHWIKLGCKTDGENICTDSGTQINQWVQMVLMAAKKYFKYVKITRIVLNISYDKDFIDNGHKIKCWTFDSVVAF